MRLALPLCLLLVGTPLLTAQAASPAPSNPAAAAKTRLIAALQKTGNLSDAAFKASWAPDKKKAAAGAMAVFGASSTASLDGSWHEDRQHYRFGGELSDEIVVAGRRTIAKDGDIAWKLRPGRFADGNSTNFLPDVQLMLQQIGSWDLAVVQTGVDSLDDRPVEVVTATLNADQVAEAVWSGLVPEALVQSDLAMHFFAAGGRGTRTAATPPSSTIDVAITIDPATSLVHQVRFRSWTKGDAGGRAGVFVVRAGAIAAGKDDEEEEEEEEVDEGKTDGPMTFEKGLPVRPRKKMSVMDYTVRVTEHGTKKAPELSGEQKKLLGR